MFPIRHTERGYTRRDCIYVSAVRLYEQVHEGLMHLTRR